jgi:hypothetical protein
MSAVVIAFRTTWMRRPRRSTPCVLPGALSL